jgi:hypothetical protein
MKEERSRQFNHALSRVRQSLNQQLTIPLSEAHLVPARAAEVFWLQYQSFCLQEDQSLLRNDRDVQEHITLARIAALTQILAPESVHMRKGLVKYLAGISHVEATRALARLTLFSAEADVRTAALDALKVRREKAYTTVLLDGLRYPWPAVAKRASEALVKLERNDLLPQLVSFLEEPDPRDPVVKVVENKRVPVVRELVRINHHRNCLLCHAPGNTPNLPPVTVTAEVPRPTDPLMPPSNGYQNAIPDVVVRVDVTYLRQDFSVLLPVTDAQPWPEMQRFDFLVRNRTLTDKEATLYREAIQKRKAGYLSPNHRAALAALRELTGRDTEPTPQAWRELLKLSATWRQGKPAS